MKITNILSIGIGATLFMFAGVALAAPKTFKPTYFSRSYATPFATGLIRTKASREFLRRSAHVSYVEENTSVPAKYSLRSVASPVEDQGMCGSCWDFALTTTLRDTWITNGKDSGRLSFNYLLNCDTRMAGCEGGDFPAADLFVNPKGAPAYGSDGAYTAESGSCTAEPAVASTVSYKLLGSDLGQNANIPRPSFKDIAYVVGVLHQAVAIDVAADSNWESYGGGVYNACSDEDPNDINHMVVIEGYDCETSVDSAGNCVFDKDGNLPAGVGTWLIRNSWGTSWGDKGYITTKATDSKGQPCNAVAMDALYYSLTK